MYHGASVCVCMFVCPCVRVFVNVCMHVDDCVSSVFNSLYVQISALF